MVDAIAKPVTDILNKGYTTSGCQFKIKAKTSLNDAAVKAVVDVSDTNVGRLKWAVPKPFGLEKVSIDKLEFDSAGAVNTEVTSTVANGCSLQLKTELNELKNVLKNFKEVGDTAVGVTYTGIADTTIKVETKLADPAQFEAELTRTFNATTVAVKCEGTRVPDVGLSHTQGPLQLVLKANQLSNLTCLGSYELDKDTQLATSCVLRGSESGAVSVGFQHQMAGGWALKAKMESDNSVSASLKHSVDGLTLLTGARFSPNSSQAGWGFGFQCTVE